MVMAGKESELELGRLSFSGWWLVRTPCRCWTGSLPDAEERHQCGIVNEKLVSNEDLLDFGLGTVLCDVEEFLVGSCV